MASDLSAPPTLLHAMAETVMRDPARDALVFRGAHVTYGDLASRSLALADRLRALGVKPGDCVGALVTPRPEALVSLLAVWNAGATWVGINTRYKLPEQRGILDDCGARVLISLTRFGDRDYTGDIEAHEAAGVRSLRIEDALWECDFPAPQSSQSPGDAWREALEQVPSEHPAVVIYTSGSTGRPKGALITHAGLTFRSYTMAKDRFGDSAVRLLLDLPINHIGALATGVGLSLVSGGLLVLAEKFDPAFTLTSIERERLNIIVGVPAMMTRITEHPLFTKADLSSLRFLCWGAGPMSERVLDRFLQVTNAKISQQYGMTESNGAIVYTPPTRDRDLLLETTGRPDPRLVVRVADETGADCAAGEEGEVQVRMLFPFAGYLNNAVATAEAFTSDGFLKTGDLAKIREDGYLVFCGRAKEMFKSGGFNVYPREVEIALEAHPSIRAAAVIPRDDVTWGQVGVAFLELGAELHIAEATSWCADRLADFKIPKTIEILQALPRTALGKVDRVELLRRVKAQDGDSPARDASFAH